MNAKIRRHRYLIILIFLPIVIFGCSTGESEVIPKPTIKVSPLILEDNRKPDITPSFATTNVVKEIDLKEIKDCYLGNQIQSIEFSSPSEIWTAGPQNITQWDVMNNRKRVFINNNNCTPNIEDPILLTKTNKGELIAGISGKGLLKWRENTWEYISPINSLFGDTIRNLLATSDGKLWVDSFSDFPISTDDAKLMAFDSHSLIGPPLISQENWGISRIIEGPKNSIIILTQKVGYPIYFNQALIFKDNELSNLFDPPLSKEYFNSVAVGFDQEIWLTSNKRLYLFENDKWKTYQTPWSKEPGSPEVVTSMVDKNGVVWFGLSFNPLMGTITDEKCGIRLDNGPEFGVYSFDGKKWRNFTTKDGLVDNKICTIAVNPDGSVWFGSYDKGLSKFDGKTWTTYSIE